MIVIEDDFILLKNKNEIISSWKKTNIILIFSLEENFIFRNNIWVYSPHVKVCEFHSKLAEQRQNPEMQLNPAVVLHWLVVLQYEL
jgi:hypothetical protein